MPPASSTHPVVVIPRCEIHYHVQQFIAVTSMVTLTFLVNNPNALKWNLKPVGTHLSHFSTLIGLGIA